MNRYFTRLAHRSGVVPAATARPGARESFRHGAAGFVEQSSEVNVESPAGLPHEPATVQTPAPPRAAPGRIMAAAAAAPPRTERASPISTAPVRHQPEQAQHRPLQAAAHVDVRPGIERAAASRMASRAAAPAAPASAIASAAPASAAPIPGFDEPASTRPARQYAAHAIVPGSRGDQASSQGSAPDLQPGTPSHHAVALSLPTPPAPVAVSAARAPLQVHIGRIEIDVRSPAPAAAPAPAPAQPIAPQPAATPPQGAPFNPHRHYLRGG
jgi:hypothetical protein